MREHNLIAASTFFNSNKKYNTWRNLWDRRPHQIDHLLIPKSQLYHTIDVKKKLDSVDSNQAALCIEFKLTNEALLFKKREKWRIPPQTKINNFLLQNSQRSKFHERVSEFFLNLDSITAAELINDEMLQIFEKHVTEATTEAAEQPITSKPD